MRETLVTVVGTLVSDMRLRRVGPDGSLVLNFRIASNERRYDRASESWVNGDSLYLSVSCWRTLAENASSLVKGDPVIVSGRLRTREWTTAEGARRSVVEMEASALGPDLARCTATVRRLRRAEEPVSTGDEFSLSAREHVEEGESLEDEEVLEGYPGLSDEVSLAELAEGARPLAPVSA